MRALVDPRIGGGANANWARDRFSANVSGTTALSLLGQYGQGAFSSAYGAFVAAYRLGAGVLSVEIGRCCCGSNPSKAATDCYRSPGRPVFAAVAYAAHIPLNGGHIRY